MDSNQSNNGNRKEIVSKNPKLIASETIENLNYLSPKRYRITHQTRWIKGIVDRGFKADFAV